jgi:hypothetical protein
MGTGKADEFRRDAVHIALASGLTTGQVVDGLGRGNADAEQMNHSAP